MAAASASAGRAELNYGEASTSDPDQGSGEDPLTVVSGRVADELTSWDRLPATVRGQTRDQR